MSKKILFHEDNAPLHKAVKTMTKLTELKNTCKFSQEIQSKASLFHRKIANSLNYCNDL